MLQRLQRFLLDGVAGKLPRGDAGASAVRGDEAQENAPRSGALVWKKMSEDVIGMARERAGHSSHSLQRVGRDAARLDVARIPQLGQGELQQGKTSAPPRSLLHELVD